MPPPVAAPAPVMPPPVETTVPAPLPPAPSPPAETNVPMVSRPAAQGEETPLTHRTWFWVAMGAAVVVVGGTVILLATRGEKFPDATFGTANGN